MNKEALKKALLYGIPSGIASWLIYGLVFRMLIDKKPFKQAMFSADSLIFLAAVTIIQMIGYYIRINKKAK